jgi:phosphomannomutase / phosphoglucomutase
LHAIPAEIFKAYDIRGIVGVTLTADIVTRIGQALGSEARERRQSDIVIGRDGRHSGAELAAALARGIQQTGINVIDLGRVATPMAYFAAQHLGCQCAAMVTGSHNPPDYNGIKMVLAGETLSGAAIQNLRGRIEAQRFTSGNGGYRQHDIVAEYIRRITDDIKLARPLNIIIDAGNGVAGDFAPPLFRALGCSVEEMYCEVDGDFPHHHPDPSVPANLADLIARLKLGDADIGIAFDGDGDRLGVVTKAGNIIFPDRLLMLFADDVLARNPGATVIFDVKSSRNLFRWIKDRGGIPLMWKSGHSLIKAKMRETGAQLAGEMSGHIFFKERWYGFDDGLYAGARLLEYLSRQTDLDACLQQLPDACCTPEIHIPMPEQQARQLLAKLSQEMPFEGALEVIRIDGLRVEYPQGFGLIRASNTTPGLVLRFEADTPETLAGIRKSFDKLLTAPHLHRHVDDLTDR